MSGIVKRRKKPVFSMKPGPKTADRVGQIYAGWQVIANAGMLDKKNTFWRLQNLQTKELVTIRGDKLKI
jgi:hypothetical protein